MKNMYGDYKHKNNTDIGKEDRRRLGVVPGVRQVGRSRVGRRQRGPNIGGSITLHRIEAGKRTRSMSHR